jgi:hypothetical protein
VIRILLRPFKVVEVSRLLSPEQSPPISQSDAFCEGAVLLNRAEVAGTKDNQVENGLDLQFEH